ncbi:MAG TPA: transketolase [Tenericutes bacterium]|nr:transketolase [Mycoplasmatota bacterium]
MEQRIISNIKSLAIDMIDKANSGHPGIVLGASPILYTLYSKHLNVNPEDHNWINRDRFVLSAGHGSAMLYSNMYMSGFDISLEDLKNFRRIGFKTPGHPEYGITPGVEISTGPLGQGIASAVGMALGAKILNSKYNNDKKPLFDFKVYVLCGDGDLMEGISYEAISFAGNLKLDNLIVIYDSNKISLDGETDLTFTENVIKRFDSMGWKTILVEDGENIDLIDQAIIKAKKSKKPTLIEVRTVIGRGSLIENSNQIHGKPLSKDDIIQLKNKLNINKESFYVDHEARNSYIDNIKNRVADKYYEWQFKFNEYVEKNLNGDYNKIDYLFRKNIEIENIDINFDNNLNEATRDTNARIMNEIADKIDYFIGGSADLASSTKTYLKNYNDIKIDDFSGKNIWFGVREHAMGAILNGLATLNFKVFGSTFLVFSDYLKPAIRLSSLMGLPVVYIFSHDSIDIGEDGPTHQPIEQLAMLRSIPNTNVFRPADANELLGSWNYILNSKKTSILVLGRNQTPILKSSTKDVSKGAYIIRKEKNNLHAIIISTGSEVNKSILIADELYEKYKLDIRVVSMVSMNLFLEQSKEYQNSIIPEGYRVIVVEPSTSFGWDKFVYSEKYLICLDKFGESGSKDEVLKHMNFDYNSIKERIIKLLM